MKIRDFVDGFLNVECRSCKGYPLYNGGSFHCRCSKITGHSSKRYSIINATIGDYILSASTTHDFHIEIINDDILFSSENIPDFDFSNSENIEFQIETFLVFK